MFQHDPTSVFEALDESVAEGERRTTIAPGKRTLTSRIVPRARHDELPAPLRGQMEQAFDTDFSRVRVHHGGDAERLDAVAYAHGDDLFFRAGAFDPATLAGRELIGHELAHVVQQREGRVASPQGKGAPIVADEALEREADEAGARAARGESAGLRTSAISAPAVAILRKPVPTTPARTDKLRTAVLMARLHLTEATLALRLHRYNQHAGPDDPIAPVANQAAAPAHVERILGPMDPADVIALLTAVRDQLVACVDGGRVVFFDGIGGNDPFVGRDACYVLNDGVGATARICIRVPGFFDLPIDSQAHHLIHEASHGAEGIETDDLAYSGERIFPHLQALGLAPSDNADSVAAAAMAAATGEEHGDPQPADHLDGLSMEESEGARIAMGMVGLAARLVSVACGPLVHYLHRCHQKHRWIRHEEHADQIADVALFQQHGMLHGKDFAAHATLVEGLQPVAHTLNAAAGLDPLTFRADPSTDGAPVSWDAQHSVVRVRPHAAGMSADQLSGILMRQGLAMLGQQDRLDMLFGLFCAFLRETLVGGEDEDEEEEEEEEEGEGKGHAHDDAPPEEAHPGQTKADGDVTTLPATTGTGAPLPRAVRTDMERAFGADFATVRVHETPAAGALAFTRGEHIHFRPGRFDPSSAGGRELLGHELTHVVQQRAGRVASSADGVNRDRSLEREADEIGARAARGDVLALGGQAAAGGAVAQQQEVEVPLEIWIALLDARMLVLEAVLRLVRGKKRHDPGVVALVQRYFGDRTTVDDVVVLLIGIDEQLAILHALRNVRCYDGAGDDDPFAVHPASIAMNVGSGTEAVMRIRVPRFTNRGSREQRQTLIHEASHGLVDNPTRDIAYAHERLFTFLPELHLALENADTISAFVGEAGTGRPDRDRTPGDLTFNPDGTRGDKRRTHVARAALGLVGLAARASARAFAEVVRYVQQCERAGRWRDDICAGARLLLNDVWFVQQILRPQLSFQECRTVFEDLVVLAQAIERTAAFGGMGWIVLDGDEAPPVNWLTRQCIEVGNCDDRDPNDVATTLLVQAFRVFDVNAYVGFALVFSSQMQDEMLGDDDSSSSGDSSSSDDSL